MMMLLAQGLTARRATNAWVMPKFSPMGRSCSELGIGAPVDSKDSGEPAC